MAIVVLRVWGVVSHRDLCLMGATLDGTFFCHHNDLLDGVFSEAVFGEWNPMRQSYRVMRRVSSSGYRVHRLRPRAQR